MSFVRYVFKIAWSLISGDKLVELVSHELLDLVSSLDNRVVELVDNLMRSLRLVLNLLIHAIHDLSLHLHEGLHRLLINSLDGLHVGSGTGSSRNWDDIAWWSIAIRALEGVVNVLDVALEHLSVLVDEQLHVVLRVVRDILDVSQLVVLKLAERLNEIWDLALYFFNCLFSLLTVLDLDRQVGLKFILSNVGFVLQLHAVTNHLLDLFHTSGFSLHSLHILQNLSRNPVTSLTQLDCLLVVLDVWHIELWDVVRLVLNRLRHALLTLKSYQLLFCLYLIG